MIIKSITLTKNLETITLAADITFKGDKRQCMFFTTDIKYQDFVTEDASPFLAALLAPCMKRNEDIYIEGNISKKVAAHIDNLMAVLVGWHVGFNQIKVHYYGTTIEKQNPQAIGSFFTGGVDSFHTYLTHQQDITHLLLIHGCDIPLKDKMFFDTVQRSVQKVAYQQHKKVIIVKTNYREIIEPKLEWEWNLGGALSAAALLLRQGLKTVYIPGGMRFDQLCAYGTHPDLDPLWSSENLNIIHDGCEFSRLEKVQYSIAKSPLALENLRVCCFILKDTYNCNKCFKCMQTKIELLCADALDQAKTLDTTISLADVRNIYYNCDLNFHIFGEDTLTYLKQHKLYPNLQAALSDSIRHSKHPSFTRKVSDWIAYLDKTYNKRRLYSVIFTLNEQQDRTFIFKTMSRLGLIK